MGVSDQFTINDYKSKILFTDLVSELIFTLSG